MQIAIRVTSDSDELRASGPRVSHTARGWEAEEHWYVQTSDELEAWNALGLPDVGDAYSAVPSSVIGLVCVRRDLVWRRGQPSATAGGIGGVTVFKLTYQTPNGLGGGGSGPQPEVGVKWSEMDSATGTFQKISNNVQNPLDPQFWDPPWNNGRGLTTEIGWLSIRVVSHATEAAFNGALQRLNRLNTHKNVNADAVTIPPLLNLQSAGSMIFQPGQLRFSGFKPEGFGSLVRITYTLDAAEDWKGRFQQESVLGHPGGPVVVVDQYLPELFAGLP